MLLRVVTIMMIFQDTTGVTIKQTIQSENHVRISTFETCMWIDGVRRSVRNMPFGRKPYVEYTINDCADLLAELHRLEDNG